MTLNTTTVTIADEDFTNGASGWSNNMTSTMDNGDEYLGNFDGQTNVSKTFDVPEGAETISVTFNFLELDSWNDESFTVLVNGTPVNLGTFHAFDDEGARSGTSNGVSWTTESQGGPSDQGAGSWSSHGWTVDQIHSVTMEIPASLLNGDDLTLTFDSNTDQNVCNESYGIDDLVITAEVVDPTEYDVICIAEENFEGGANGWTNNTTNTLLNGDEYLGNFDGQTNVSKTFDVPAGAEHVTVSFDFLELDSWNSEGFSVVVNGVEVDLGSFHAFTDEGTRSGTTNGIEWSTESQGGPSEQGASVWACSDWSVDQIHTVTLEIPASIITSDELTLTFDSHTDQSVHNESYGIDDLVIKAYVPTDGEPSNMVKVDFNNLSAGTIVSDQYEGLTISAQRSQDGAGSANDAMIFDTDNPTGGDWDLGVGTGGALIISEDGDSSDPDDNWSGGTITFEFDTPSTVDSMRIIDVDHGETNNTVTLFDASGAVIATLPMMTTGDSNSAMMQINVEGVSRMEVFFQGSGALDDLCYEPETGPQPGSVAGTYFVDTDGNGLNDDGATVEGVTVELLDGTGAVVASAVTGADGSYDLGNVPAGTYTIQFGADPDGRVFTLQDAGDDTIDSDVDSTGAASVTVGEGEALTVDAGVTDPMSASISGRYFVDSDGDNQDNSEAGVGAVQVVALTAAGVVAGSATTAADGTYSIGGLAAGDYTLVFAGVADFAFVDANVGDDATDSDVITTLAGGDGETAAVTVGIGEAVANVGAGIAQVDPGDASISGRYFLDSDGDNRDNGEAGEAGVAVTVVDTATGAVAGTAVTGPNGEYSVGGLFAGNYQVVFGTIEFGEFVTADQGDDLDDSDVTTVLGSGEGQTDAVSVAISEAVDNVDAGVRLVDPNTGSISGTAFFDADANDRNDGEAGVDNLTVELINADTGAVVDTATTGPSGAYSFTNLSAGNYQVSFGAQAGFVFSNPDVGSDVGDSDVTSTGGAGQGLTDVITLGFEGVATDVDAGYIDPNDAPIALDDAGMICANEELTIDVLANDSDPDGVDLTVTSVNGVAIADGQTIDVGGVMITLNGGALSFDGEMAFDSLTIGEEQNVTYTYTIEDADGAEASANIDVSFKGVASTLAEIEASLPSTLQYQLIFGGPDAYTMKLTSVDGTGAVEDARFDGVIIEQAYCVSAFEGFLSGPDFATAPLLTGDVYLADAASVPADLWFPFAVGTNGQTPFDNLDLINYIINQDYSALFPGSDISDLEIQSAIWGLTDGFSFIDPLEGDQADVDLVLNDAIANGEGFEAGAGDLVGLIVDPGDADFLNTQPLIIGINFDDIDCLC